MIHSNNINNTFNAFGNKTWIFSSFPFCFLGSSGTLGATHNETELLILDYGGCGCAYHLDNSSFFFFKHTTPRTVRTAAAPSASGRSHLKVLINDPHHPRDADRLRRRRERAVELGCDWNKSTTS